MESRNKQAQKACHDENDHSGYVSLTADRKLGENPFLKKGTNTEKVEFFRRRRRRRQLPNSKSNGVLLHILCHLFHLVINEYQ